MHCPYPKCADHTPCSGGGEQEEVLAYPAPKTPWDQTQAGPHPMSPLYWMRFMSDVTLFNLALHCGWEGKEWRPDRRGDDGVEKV